MLSLAKWSQSEMGLPLRAVPMGKKEEAWRGVSIGFVHSSEGLFPIFYPWIVTKVGVPSSEAH